MEALLGWLSGLPAGALAGLLVFLAWLENVFPPAPSDTIIAFTFFLMARGGTGLSVGLALVVAGHLAGAATMFALGRRWGAERVRAWLATRGEAKAEAAFEDLYGRYGFAALLVGRFIPFVRGVVPLVAGALRVRALAVLAVTAMHALVWYAVIGWAAYRVGENFTDVVRIMRRGGATLGLVAVTVAVVVLAAWWWRRRQRRTRRP